MIKRNATVGPPKSPNKSRLLVVSPLAERHSALRSMVGAAEWTVSEAGSRRQALQLIQRTEFAVVICERDLPDGDWVSLFDKLTDTPRQPSFIVCSHLADEQLWAEALNRGAYDVLAVPFEINELQRVIFLAREAHHREMLQRKAGGKPAKAPAARPRHNPFAAGMAG